MVSALVVFDESKREQTGSGLFIHMRSSCVKSVGALWSPHINRMDSSVKSSEGGSLVRHLISVPLSSLYLRHNSKSLHQHVLNDSTLPRTRLSALHLCASLYGSHGKLRVWAFKRNYWRKWERCAIGHTNIFFVSSGCYKNTLIFVVCQHVNTHVFVQLYWLLCVFVAVCWSGALGWRGLYEVMRYSRGSGALMKV